MDETLKLIIEDTWYNFFLKAFNKKKNYDYCDLQAIMKQCFKNAVTTKFGNHSYVAYYRFIQFDCIDICSFIFVISCSRYYTTDKILQDIKEMFLETKHEMWEKARKEINKQNEAQSDKGYILSSSFLDSINNIKF